MLAIMTANYQSGDCISGSESSWSTVGLLRERDISLAAIVLTLAFRVPEWRE